MYNTNEIMFFALYFGKFLLVPVAVYGMGWIFAKVTYKMHKMGIIK